MRLFLSIMLALAVAAPVWAEDAALKHPDDSLSDGDKIFSALIVDHIKHAEGYDARGTWKVGHKKGISSLRFSQGLFMLGFAKDKDGWYHSYLQVFEGKKIFGYGLDRGEGFGLTLAAQVILERKYAELTHKKKVPPEANAKANIIRKLSGAKKKAVQLLER